MIPPRSSLYPPGDQLSRALAATAQMITVSPADQWANLTGVQGGACAMYSTIWSGQPELRGGPDRPSPPDRDVDHLSDDPAAAYRRARQALRAAFAQPGVSTGRHRDGVSGGIAACDRGFSCRVVG